MTCEGCNDTARHCVGLVNLADKEELTETLLQLEVL